MKNNYISPQLLIVSVQPQEFCADNISNYESSNGIYSGNADTLRDGDYE